jgi:hypothetical protein
MNDKEDLAARLAALIADQERPLEIICDEQTKLGSGGLRHYGLSALSFLSLE